MPKISIRLSVAHEAKLSAAAKKADLALSEYIRRILFADNACAKVDFYTNIMQEISEIRKQSAFTTQLLCQVLVNQTDIATVQALIKKIKKDMEGNGIED